MVTILRRLILILKAWVNAVLASAEDPRQVFAEAYQRQEIQLSRVREAQKAVAGSRARLEAQTADVRSKLPQLEERARHALVSGREDLARFALQLRLAALEDLRTLEEQVGDLEKEERALSLVEQRLSSEIEALRARQEVIEARYTTAEAHVRLYESLGGLSDEVMDLGPSLERLEQRTEGMQARASAINRLVAEGVLEMPTRTPTQDNVLRLSYDPTSEAVEEHLFDLKQQVRQAAPAPPARASSSPD